MTTDSPETSVFEFPCRFPIKVMAHASDSLAADVAAIVAKHHPDPASHEITTRPSSAGRYAAVTVVIEAHSREQLDNIYRELTAQTWVLMAL